MLMQSTVSFAFSREKQMLKRTPVLMLSVLLFCPLSLWTQGSAARDIDNSAVGPEQLYSPSISQAFYEIASDLAGSKNVTGPEVEQAMAFLSAAMRLDRNAGNARELLIELACRVQERDYSNLIYSLLIDYVDERADLELATNAVEYLGKLIHGKGRGIKIL